MRISPKPADACPWYLWPFFWNHRHKYGTVLDSALLWARAPRVFLGVAFLYGMIDRKNSPLNPGLRSLVTVRVCQLNGCRFCVDINSATLLKRGVPVGQVEALDVWQQSVLFSDRERVALEYAEAVTLRSDAIDEHLMEQLKRHFDDDAIIELTALIAAASPGVFRNIVQAAVVWDSETPGRTGATGIAVGQQIQHAAGRKHRSRARRS
jgi:AhpD family alkylhydroperoxidase